MSDIIYYFSGRGNSYDSAKSLAERMDNTSICSMSKAKENKVAERIGIITPVIDLGIPSYVRRFIKTLQRSTHRPYVFAVITCGGMPAASMSQLKRCLSLQGMDLSAGFILKFGIEPITDEAWGRCMDDIASAAKDKKKVDFPQISTKDKLLSSCGNRLARVIIPGEDKKFCVSDVCSGCGICERLCPIKNIETAGGKPVWKHHCEQCAACFGWCPKQAITGKNLAARTRYTNPHVTLEQMLNDEADKQFSV